MDEETKQKLQIEIDFKEALSVTKPKRNKKKEDEDSTVCFWAIRGRIFRQ
jgi:hypothetical protein